MDDTQDDKPYVPCWAVIPSPPQPQEEPARSARELLIGYISNVLLWFSASFIALSILAMIVDLLT